MRQVVEGVQYLHSHNILHRDMSLSNLLLTKDMQVKIADFGLATQLSRPDEKHMTMCGTPNFISPEIASRGSHGLEADVWSLGCLLYTLLVGTPPFDTQAVKSTLTRVVMANYQLPNHLSPEAKDLINALLQKNPKDRIKLNQILEHPFIKRNYYSSGTATDTTQDSGIYTMSSKRDNSAFTDGIYSCNTYSDRLNRKYNSDCTPILPCQVSAHSSRSVDRLANHLQQTNLLQDNYLRKEASEPISVFSQHGSAIGLHGEKVLQEERPFVHSHCSQNCCQPTDPGGGAAGFFMQQPQRCTVQTSCCSHQSKLGHECSGSKIEGRYLSDDNPHSHPNQNNAYGNYSECPKSTPNASSHKAENIRQSSNNLQQLCALRLLPTRHQTKNAILTILDTGEVCVEFMKKKGPRKKEMVCEICRISPDGERIVFYEPEGGKGAPPGIKPPELPPQGTDQIFNFENLPEKHWKKYMYAFKFIELVRAKTPKVTLYSDKAKCMLMENLVDYECCFYDGGKVTQSKSEGITIIDSSGTRLNFRTDNSCHELPNSLNLLWNHSQEFKNQCLLLETTISALPGQHNFPIIVGRRPQSFTVSTPGKENKSQNSMPSFSTNATTCNTPISLNSATLKEKKISVPGIGTAIQFPSGEVKVRFTDGSQLSIDGKHHVQYQYTDGKVATYADTDNIPRPIMEKLQLMPKVLRHLMPSPVLSKMRCLR
ncbi:protein kinase [Oryctes borbonicus]|uniref:Serine/threonine-protein kinase PLK4 n=1 Tax=Oryctes borbonicus TaxID=1629725 RepID=A0A0T6B164_9SCAR|nr:protein kinase [Oryctes borbonicus]